MKKGLSRPRNDERNLTGERNGIGNTGGTGGGRA